MRLTDTSLDSVYGTSLIAPDPRTFDVPDVRIFRLCLLFTAVSERLVDDTSTLFRLRSTELYRLAIAHLPAAFRLDQMVSTPSRKFGLTFRLVSFVSICSA